MKTASCVNCHHNLVTSSGYKTVCRFTRQRTTNDTVCPFHPTETKSSHSTPVSFRVEFRLTGVPTVASVTLFDQTLSGLEEVFGRLGLLVHSVSMDRDGSIVAPTPQG